MPTGCFLCREPFDSAVGIVATECGHLFHLMCINGSLRLSKYCPQCEREVSEDNLTKVYFHDFSGKKFRRPLDTVKDQIHTQTLQLQTMQKKIDNLLSACASSDNEAKELRQVEKSCKKNVRIVTRTLQMLLNMAALNDTLAIENTGLERDVEDLNHFQLLVDECDIDSEMLLMKLNICRRTEKGRYASQRVASYCAVVKQSLTRLSEKNAELKSKIEKIKRQMRTGQPVRNKKSGQQEKNSSSKNGPRFTQNMSKKPMKMSSPSSDKSAGPSSSKDQIESELPKKNGRRFKKIDNDGKKGATSSAQSPKRRVTRPSKCPRKK